MAVNAEENQLEQQNKLANPQSTGGGQAQAAPGSAPGTPASRVASYSSGSQPGQSGSGRFTNLQNYIGANQGASDRLASGISSNLSKETAPEKKAVSSQAADVRAGIESAQNKLNTGSQYLDQVKGADFNAQSFAGDQNKLQDFTNYRTNQAVGADQLATQANQAQTAANTLQAQQQQQLQNASSEAGRFNLLKNAFGGGSVYQNPYSTGQQRLDQLFLQAGGNNNVNKIQNQVRGDLNATGQTLNTLSQNAGVVGQIGTQAKDLATGLQTATTDLTNQYVTGIEGTAADVNAKRAADQEWANQQYANLQAGGQVDQRFADMLGLSQGQNIYQTLVGKNANDFLNYGPQSLSGFGQLANTQQEQYYDALARLSGATPGFIMDGDPSAAVGNNDKIGSAITAGTDAFNTAVGNQSGNYTWGGGGIVPVSGSVSSQAAQSLLSGISKEGLDKFRGLSDEALNSSNLQEYNNGITNTLRNQFGLSESDTNALLQALNSGQINVNAQGPGGDTYANYAKLGALKNMANILGNSGYGNRVNIAPPSDLESGGQFGVT